MSPDGDSRSRLLLAVLGVALVMLGVAGLLLSDELQILVAAALAIPLGAGLVVLAAFYRDDVLVRWRNFEVSVRKRRRG